MRWIGLLALLVACEGTNGADDTADTSDTSDTSDTADTSDTDLGPTGEAHGVVKDADGNTVAGAQVNLCRLVCTTVETDSAGAYDFIPLEIGDYSFHIVPPLDSGLGEPLVPFTIEEDVDAEVDVVLPTLGSAVTLPTGTAAEIEAAPGLFLTVKQGDLDVAFEDPPTVVRGVLVDADDYLPMDVPGTVIAVWYLDPYEASAEDVGGLPIRIRNDFSLASGDTFALYRASYWDYDFVQVGTFTASETELTNSAARLPELTTLVLVDPD